MANPTERAATIRCSVEDVERAWADAGIPGKVSFRNAPGDRGVEVHVTTDDKNIQDQLRHFKERLETGEVMTTDGQPSGRKS